MYRTCVYRPPSGVFQTRDDCFFLKGNGLCECSVIVRNTPYANLQHHLVSTRVTSLRSVAEPAQCFGHPSHESIGDLQLVD